MRKVIWIALRNMKSVDEWRLKNVFLSNKFKYIDAKLKKVCPPRQSSGYRFLFVLTNMDLIKGLWFI